MSAPLDIETLLLGQEVFAENKLDMLFPANARTRLYLETGKAIIAHKNRAYAEAAYLVDRYECCGERMARDVRSLQS